MPNDARRRIGRRNTSKNDNNRKMPNVNDNRSFRQNYRDIDNIIGQMNLSLYGTDRVSDVQRLDAQFDSILNSEVNAITKADKQDITSFLSQMVSKDAKNSALAQLYNNQYLAMSGDDYTTMQSFIYDAYRNRLLEQSDLHEVASQLIELSEAILITRDAITSANIVEGSICRDIQFKNCADEDVTNAINVVESVENRFDLKRKIKNFIVPKTLEYGSYYAYTIPYSKIFKDFNELKNQSVYGKRMYGESVSVMESAFDTSEKNKDKDFNKFIDNLYNEYTSSDNRKKSKSANIDNITAATNERDNKKAFVEDVKTMLGNISISNDPIPLPYVLEGIDSIDEFKESFVSESGESFKDSGKYFSEKTTKKSENPFDILSKSGNSADGVYVSNKKSNDGNFDNIKDCYNKLLSPLEVIPVEIMNTPIGYYYVQTEDITPIAGAVSSTLYYTRFDEHRKEKTVVDAIAAQVVKSFDKKFLEDNIEFKKLIVDCIQYYNLNEKRLKFQFIPVDYITEFKIDEDVDGHGQSMIKKSLFYAKLYLMLLLFKIMTIVMNSNDIKVNYLKSSGIDKDIVNQVQEIARIRQSRQINMTDLFSYTTLINKVGNGSEMYIPTGRSGERPIETEILSGQDVQLNSDLLEMLKNAYILATGVPAAILNYLNEADFAKSVEEDNTKYNGRVVNYQIDFNPSISEWYKKILRWSTNLEEHLIDNFEFTFQPPKTKSTMTKADTVGQFQAYSDFITGLFFKNADQAMDDPELLEQIRQFKILLASDQLPMINIDKINDLVNKSKLLAKAEMLRPDPNNGNDGNDDGLEEFGLEDET